MDMGELDQRAGTKAVGYTSSHWHRDIRGRQVKVMLYLTDVTERDSNFAFLLGTHKNSYVRPRRIEESRFNEEWVISSGIKPVECYGQAGTAMIFDTNLIHRLRRKPGSAVRDSITFYYTPSQETRALDVDPGLIKDLPEEARLLFKGRRPASGQAGDSGA
jgi:ectoine hydroxylase-related dioxygenase (phytanoyl-CoA dioxygenase family)